MRYFRSLITWFRFAFLNFAAPVAFYLVFQKYGAKPAIGIALFFTVIQIWAHYLLRERISPFFYAGTVFTLVFGGTDLLIRSPRYFRLEPFVTNLVLGLIFVGTSLRKNPILKIFVDALPSQVRPDATTLTDSYMRGLTRVWGVYLLLKGFFFLWLAFQVNLGNLIVLRAIVGGGSGALLIGGEILYRKLTSRSVAAPQH